jgi:hypothetical protein
MLKTVSTQLALASDTLPEVLAKGNTTGGTDLAVSAGDDITFADNSKAIFGAGSDLSIYSDGATGQVTGNVNVTGAATFGGNVQVNGSINTNLQSLSAWSANTRAIELTTYGAVSSNDNTGTAALSVNAYESSDSAWNRVAGTNASRFQTTYSGEHKWSTAIGAAGGSAIAWVDQMTLDASGNLSPTGNVVLANGKGIDFSATAGTGSSEVLSDYEEGTWTPDYTAWTATPTFISGRYIKIGSQVSIMILGQNGQNAGNEAIAGLPFLSNNGVSATGGLKEFGSSSVSTLCNVDTNVTTISSFEAVTFSGYWSLSVTYFITI